MAKARIARAAVKKAGHVTSKPRPARHKDLGMAGGTKGFLTGSGRFVNRKQGAAIAKKAGQVRNHQLMALHTEDLW